MTERCKAARLHASAHIVPVVAMLYLASGCTATFWDQHYDKGEPKDYLFTTQPGAAAATPSRVPRPDPPTASHPAPGQPIPQPAPQPPDADYAAVCVDPITEIRAADEDCAEAEEEFDGTRTEAYQYATRNTEAGTVLFWYYFGTQAGRTAPPLGGRVSGGSYTVPSAGTGRAPVIIRSGSVPVAGGSITRETVKSSVIQRGGFGSSSTGSASS